MSQHEEEQLENIKRFWQDYGTPILLGVTIALAGFGGWTWWKKEQASQAAAAGMLFQDLLVAADRAQVNPADEAAVTDMQRHARTLKEDYARTPFAQSAALLLARHAVDNDKLDDAAKQLRWVIDSNPSEGVRVLAVTRLARVLAEQGKYDEAQALLEREQSAGFAPTVQELRGDIFQMQGKTEDARKAYLAAAEALRARDEQRPLLELKMADVGLAPLPPKTDDDAK